MFKQREIGAEKGRKRAVIFDFDGTIADSLRAFIDVFEEMTDRPGHYTDAEIDSCRSMSIPELIKWLGVPAWKVPILLMRGRKMLKAHMHGIAVHNGMADVVKALHRHGVPLYVLSSNSTENVQKYLQWHHLSEYFAGVYGGASVFAKAPHMLKCIEAEDIDVASSWCVGDETRDVSAAHAVGMRIASVSWGFNTRAALERKEPTVIVDTAKELLAVLKDTWKK